MNENKLAEILGTQVRQTEQLILILEQERICLEQLDADRLLSTIENKNHISQQINQTSHQLQQFLQDNSHSDQLSRLDEFIEQQVTEQIDYIKTLSQTLKTNLRQSKMLNDSNGQIIASSQQINENMKRIFNLTKEYGTYDPTGKLRSYSEKHILSKA